jgi:hypothetical protein
MRFACQGSHAKKEYRYLQVQHLLRTIKAAVQTLADSTVDQKRSVWYPDPTFSLVMDHALVNK